MVSAMEQMQMEPVIIEDLVKFGEDRGFDRGFDRGVKQGLEQGLEQGATQTRVQIYLSMFEENLGRPLTAIEQAVLAKRVTSVPTKRLNELALRATPSTLEAWLADPTAK